MVSENRNGAYFLYASTEAQETTVRRPASPECRQTRQMTSVIVDAISNTAAMPTNRA